VPKIPRESAPPERNALRSRGCPNPDYDRRPVLRRPRPVTRRPGADVRQTVPLGRLLATAAGEMRDAQGRVAELKAQGLPYEAAARHARMMRARWLDLRGEGPEGSEVEPAGYAAPAR
jgi:hypothetical protein